MLRYKEIKNNLLYEISKHPPGTKLPSRPILCRNLDTTRTTLDKAIKELIEEGFLTSGKGSGTYVVGLIEGVPATSASWGIIVPNVMEAIYSGLVRSIENNATKYGLNLIICNSDNDPDKQEQYVKRLLLSGVSGMVIVPVVSNDIRINFRLYNQLVSANTPFVFCNRSVEGINVPTITSNDFYGGYIATNHLIKKGYKKIAYISKIKYKTSIDRCQGYISALMENDFTIDRDLIVFSDDPYSSVQSLLFDTPDIDAFFCFNDSIALSCYKAITDLKLEVSDDIGLIGYDNTDSCLMVIRNISSVSYMQHEIGQKASEILWKLQNNKEVLDFEYYLVKPSIVDRDSCLGPKSL